MEPTVAKCDCGAFELVSTTLHLEFREEGVRVIHRLRDRDDNPDRLMVCFIQHGRDNYEYLPSGSRAV